MNTKEKPILFSTPMVQAILDGRKTQTRRILQPKYDKDRQRYARLNMLYSIHRQNTGTPNLPFSGYSFDGSLMVNDEIVQPRYQPGDVLWVRETFCFVTPIYEPPYYAYRADGKVRVIHSDIIEWRPSIHMPRSAARIFLRVTDVRAERVQSISEGDAMAEGVPTDYPMDAVYCPVCKGGGLTGTYNPSTLGFMEIDCPHCDTAISRFRSLWDKLNAKRGCGWDVNPWVWVYTFELIELEENDNVH